MTRSIQQGQQYGRLKAVQKAARKDFYVFLCSCGQTVEKRKSVVKYGTTQSCGCLRREKTAARKFIDLTGRKVGRLQVIERCGTRSGRALWRCLCDCGKYKNVANLRGPRATKSCGCLHIEAIRKLGQSSKKEFCVSRTKEYRKKIKDKRRQRPEVCVQERISRMMCLALKGIEITKGGRTFELLGYSPQILTRHIERQFLPGMSWENRNLWEIDHIIPVSTAKTKEDVIHLNQLSNLRPMWAKDNNAKKNKRLYLL